MASEQYNYEFNSLFGTAQRVTDKLHLRNGEVVCFLNKSSDATEPIIVVGMFADGRVVGFHPDEDNDETLYNLYETDLRYLGWVENWRIYDEARDALTDEIYELLTQHIELTNKCWIEIIHNPDDAAATDLFLHRKEGYVTFETMVQMLTDRFTGSTATRVRMNPFGIDAVSL